jgi:acyl-CoA thioester hydrolase
MIRPPSLELPTGARVCRHLVRVIFGDTDAAGIVYYANYLRYFEAARGELMRELGLPYSKLFEEGITMPVIEQWWRYRAPARYDDVLLVSVWVHELGSASILVGAQIHKGDVLFGEGAVRLGCVDTHGAPRRLPAELVRLAAGPVAP